MATRSVIQVGLAILALFSGGAVMLFTAGVMRHAVQGDFYLLMRDYDPNAQAAEQPSERYRDLYAWTERLIHQRNKYALAFHYTLGTSFIIAALALIAWTIDRERARRGFAAPKGDRNRQSNGEAGNAQRGN